jgi:hypothetical protein
MRTVLLKTISAVLTAGLIFSSTSIQAQELNVPGFSGSINTTLTSGFTARASGRDCELQDGYVYQVDVADIDSTTAQVALGGFTPAQVYAVTRAAHQPITLSRGNKNLAGCGLTAKTDAYGNTASDQINIGNVNSDDGNLNFNQGDIVDATQRFFTSITGRTDSGIGVNLSLAGSVNPVLDITTPHFKKLNEKAENTLNHDLSLLDAYVTGGFETYDGTYVDVTAGRFVTSWGEATFIPVTMNGLVTNAVDLTKLRAPGSAIREALTPTEQISLNFNAGDWGIETYYQFQSETVKLDPAGSFYGNEVAGPGGFQILASGANTMERNLSRSDGCTFTAVILQGLGCNAATVAVHTDVATRDAYSTISLGREAQIGASSTLWNEWTDRGRTQDFGSMAFLGTPGTFIVSDGLSQFTHADTTAAHEFLSDTVYTAANQRANDFLTKATVEVRAHKQKHVYAKDSGQFGLKASRFFDNVGSGVDIGFYFANYHSKVPYARIVGKGGVLAGDHVGIYKTEHRDYVGALASGGDGSGLGHDALNSLMSNADTFAGVSSTLNGGLASTAVDATTLSTDLTGDTLAEAQAFLALANGAFSGGVCGGFTFLSTGHQFLTSASSNTVNEVAAKSFAQELLFGTEVDGMSYHNPTNCLAGGLHAATSTNAYLGYGATLLATITPLNLAEYQFVYPENNKVFGMSFNTNIAGTTVQGEVAYRPNFPLATATGDQINEIGDRSGATAGLTLFAVESYGTTTNKATAITAYKQIVDGVMGAGSFESLVINNRRSSLPFLGVAPDTDYYSTHAIEYDVASFDIGTTTTFSASHPVTVSLGADSAVFLTELASVYIADLNNKKNGFVARGGFNEGNGEHLCLGMFAYTSQSDIDAINAAANASATFTGALTANDARTAEYNIDTTLDIGSRGLTNLGASITDALFGNGSYCEDRMGADHLSATYRLIGSATYNNVGNSAWSMSPSVAFAHDFMGYGPSSLGGFVEDKASLSLSLSAVKNAVSVNLNYVNQLGPNEANTKADMDTVSASVSYSF